MGEVDVPERRQRTCKCGYTRSHDNIVEEPEYSLWGWIVLSMFGITPKPNHVVYRCQMCRQSLGTTRDPKVLARRSQPTKTKTPTDAAEVKKESARP